MIGYVTPDSNDVARAAALVHEVHQDAMALGATDEGAPGPRGNGGFYAGCFPDSMATRSAVSAGNRAEKPGEYRSA